MYKVHKKESRFLRKSLLRRKATGAIIIGKGVVKVRDFPIFTTEYGLSSLVLKEIPYKNQAYIRILDLQPGKLVPHLRECVSFCRMAGAERIFAAGAGLEDYPVYTHVLSMQGQARVDPGKVACLFPVTEQTAARWREVYNRAMKCVDNASTLEGRDEKIILEKPGACFVHDNGTLLGIGWLADNKLLAVAAVQRGAGEQVVNTLLSLVEGETVTLEVASTNQKAIALYERLGFVKTGIVTTWHDVTACN